MEASTLKEVSVPCTVPSQVVDLKEFDLALVGGGIGDVILA